MPTVRAGLMMTNVSLCRLQQQQCRQAAEGEKQEGERLWLRTETVRAHFLMAGMETRLEMIGCP